jgi:hypothetical protein
MADNELKVRVAVTEDVSAVVKKLQAQLKALQNQAKNIKMHGLAKEQAKLFDPLIMKWGKLSRDMQRGWKDWLAEGKAGTAEIKRLNQAMQPFVKKLKEGASLSKKEATAFRQMATEARMMLHAHTNAHKEINRNLNRQARLRKDIASIQERSLNKLTRAEAQAAARSEKETEKANRSRARIVRFLGGLHRAEQSRQIAEDRKIAAASTKDWNDKLGQLAYLNRVRRNSERDEQARRTRSYREERRHSREQFAEIRESFRLRQRSEALEQAEQRRAGTARRAGFMRLGQAGQYALDRTDKPFFNSPFFYLLAGAGLAVAATRSFAEAAKELDAAITGAATHVFLEKARLEGGNPLVNARRMADDQMANWGIPTAISLGMRPGELVTTAFELSKAGVPNKNNLVEDTTELAAKLVSALGGNLHQVTTDIGFAVAQQFGRGELNKDSVTKLLNATAQLAGSMNTSTEQMAGFMRTGLGSGRLIGMSDQGTMAFGAAVTSVGAEGGQASRMLARLGVQLSDLEGRSKDIRRKGSKSEDDKAFLRLPGMLGYGSFGNMSKRLRSDPDNEIFNIINSFSKIKDPLKRSAAVEAIFGQQWVRFIGQMIDTPNIGVEARKLAKQAFEEADKDSSFLNQAFGLSKMQLGFYTRRIDAVWQIIKASLGQALIPFFKGVSDFLDANRELFKGAGLKDRFAALLNGILSGMGFVNLWHVMDAMTRSLKSGSWDVNQFKKFGQGIGEGLRIIGNALGGLSKALGISNAETLGKFLTLFLGFTLALHFLRPVIGVMSGLTFFLMELGKVFLALKGVSKLSAMAGAAGGVAGRMALGGAAAGAVGIGLTGALILGIAGYFAQYRGQIATAMIEGMKSVFWSVVEALKEFFAGDWKGQIQAAILQGLKEAFLPDLEALKRLLKRAPDWSQGQNPGTGDFMLPPGYQQQNFYGEDWRSLIQHATFTQDELDDTTGSLRDQIRLLNQNIEMDRKNLRSAFGGGGSGGGSGSGGGGGSSSTGDYGLGGYGSRTSSFGGGSVTAPNFKGGGSGSSGISARAAASRIRRGITPSLDGGSGGGSVSGGTKGGSLRDIGKIGGSSASANYPNELGAAIRQSAKDLGINAEDLATMISFETAGTFDPWKKGPTTKWGTHRGLIQWGEPQARDYGVYKGMPVGEQMKAVTRYLKDKGVRPGMNGANVYAAINAGNANKLGARDAAAGGTWGTVLDKWKYQMGGHRRKAQGLLRNSDSSSVAGGTAPNLGNIPRRATPDGVVNSMPSMPWPQNWKGGGGGSGAGAGGPVSINIHGGSHDPERLATKVQERMQETRNWRTHDVQAYA